MRYNGLSGQRARVARICKAEKWAYGQNDNGSRVQICANGTTFNAYYHGDYWRLVGDGKEWNIYRLFNALPIIAVAMSYKGYPTDWLLREMDANSIWQPSIHDKINARGGYGLNEKTQP